MALSSDHSTSINYSLCFTHETVFHHVLKCRRESIETRCSSVFLRNIKLFGIVMKHCCLIKTAFHYKIKATVAKEIHKELCYNYI